FGIVFDPGEGGPADGTGDAQILLDAFDAEGFGAERAKKATGENVSFFAVGVTGEQKKLFPAPADNGIGKARRGTDAPCHLDQNIIPYFVSKLVVHPLEVIDIDQIEDEIAVASLGGSVADKRTQDLLYIGDDGIGEEAAVANSGEQVGQGRVQQLAVRAGQFFFQASLFHDADKSEDHDRSQ